MLPTVLSILLFIIAIFFFIIPQFQESIMDGKREMIQELTHSAWSILSKYEADEKDGLLTREEAQKTAISRIQYLRYGEENKDYFWITDMTPRMIMHPFREDLNGKDLTEFKDPHGKKMFVAFVETVKEKEHGFVDYMWQWKDDSLHIVPKLSYVKLFKPWGWVIGTGVYIEDVKKEITALTNRLLLISFLIFFIIAALLLYIVKQSLNIEKKRFTAENELRDSKEKYKTLVEATTEGLIMLIDGRISFANHVISRITGFANHELINNSLNEIISKNNNGDILETFSKKIVKEGIYELNMQKKKGGIIEVLVTSSLASFNNNSVNIIIIKDVSIDTKQSYSNIDYQKLISTLNLGFFKVRIDNAGKFIYANETAIRILGYDSFTELSGVNLLRFFVDTEDRKKLRKILLTEGFIKNKILKIQKKNRSFSIVALSLVVFNEDTTNELICDGIVEDITQKEEELERYKSIIVDLKTSSFITEQSVKDYLTPIFSIDVDTSIGNCVSYMTNRKTDVLLLSKYQSDILGILTTSDIQKRVLAYDLKLNNPGYLIMSSPIIYVYDDCLISDAIKICLEKNIQHLVVKSINNEIIGHFNTREFFKTISNSLSFLNIKVNDSFLKEEIKEYYKQLQLFVKPLIISGISTETITGITSSFSDNVIRRVIDLTIQEIGPPPLQFAFICLGSEGRKEESLLTDQDNAIIYENPKKEKEREVGAYFLLLGEKVCSILNEIGYSFCKGNVMAQNPQWNKPESLWEDYFTNWIMTPEPKNLLDATIFFDLRCVFGNENLVTNLQSLLTELINKQSVFLYHMAQNAYITKFQHLSASSVLTDKPAEFIDLKGCLNHIIMFARIYSLQHNIWKTNTVDRLTALKNMQIISENTINEMLFVYHFLMKLRLKNQVLQIESNISLSNILNTKTLSDLEYSVFKRILAQLPVFQNKIGLDFRLKN
jgi:PAS domain S-box-containing protein